VSVFRGGAHQLSNSSSGLVTLHCACLKFFEVPLSTLGAEAFKRPKIADPNMVAVAGLLGFGYEEQRLVVAVGYGQLGGGMSRPALLSGTSAAS